MNAFDFITDQLEIGCDPTEIERLGKERFGVRFDPEQLDNLLDYWVNKKAINSKTDGRWMFRPAISLETGLPVEDVRRQLFLPFNDN